MSLNRFYVSGTVCSEPTYEYNYEGTNYYKFVLTVHRNNNKKKDNIPVIIPETLVPIMNETVLIGGRIKTRKAGKKSVKTFLFANEIKRVTLPVKTKCSQHEINFGFLEGTVCRAPDLFKKNNKIKAELKLAVTYCRTGETAYVPLVFWQDNALFVKEVNIGDKMFVSGYLRSRHYYTKEGALKGTHEVSVSQVKMLE